MTKPIQPSPPYAHCQRSPGKPPRQSYFSRKFTIPEKEIFKNPEHFVEAGKLPILARIRIIQISMSE